MTGRGLPAIARAAARLLAPLALLVVLAAGAQADEKTKEPVEIGDKDAPPPTVAPLEIAPHPISDMLTDLQRVQARMANGDASAYGAQSDRLRAMAEAILAANPTIWLQKSETDAAAAYALSGGQPRTIAKLLESGATPKSEEPLLRGSLAYAAGRVGEAAQLLSGIDPRSVSLRLAGQLAYAESVLKTGRSPEEAIRFLDWARVLAPGGLVEEAALRREILLAGDQRQGDRVIFLARQYVSRFPHSIYADNFIQGLSTASVRFGLLNDLANLRKFETLLMLATLDQRRDFLLKIARAQTIGGKYEVAGAAAQAALSEMTAEGPDATRARFYLAAAELVGDDHDAGLAALNAIDRAKLNGADQSLLSAALQVSVRMRETPSDSAFEEADHENAVAAARSPDPVDVGDADPAGATIRRAEQALQRGDTLIRSGEAPP